ncbi:MAG: hypothetical protein R3B46_10400 [Phycisphaerales bacterium]
MSKANEDHWVKWYENVLEFKMFKHFDDADISTEYSALMSKGHGLRQQPHQDAHQRAAPGKKESQILEYLEIGTT